MNEDNKHLWIVIPLVSLAALMVVAAGLIPLARWAFSAVGFVSILGACILLKEVGLLRGKARVIVPVLFYAGLWCIHGFDREFIRQNITLPPAQQTNGQQTQP